MSIAGKGVIVTGGSRGLGAALAKSLAERGARLALVGRDAAALDQVVAQIRRAGGEAHGLTYDVGDKSAVYPLAGSARALLGTIDVLVHNASTLGPTPLRLLLDTECEDLQRVLDVNLLGPFRLTKAIAGAMVLQGGGTIVHISSDASQHAYARWGAYSVSKAALDHLSRLWATELGKSGVRTFSVDPGEMNTAMHHAAVPEADPATLADPATVALDIVRLLESADSIENGARFVAGGQVPT
jgi:NAD(P)-dependent dehydrogenase (short-subunit alcohol dehydrogenase family)